MIRIALFVALVLLFVGIFRMTRALLAGRTAARRTVRRPAEAEMVRDPVCGTWIDRRLALSASAEGGEVAVCSERCLRQLQGAR